MCKRYILSDVHGHFDALRDTLSLVDLSDGKSELILLGDYINRGSQGYEVLEHLMKLEEIYPNQVRVLLGNHDKTLIDWLSGKVDFVRFHWLDGSLQTIEKFLTKEQYASYAAYFSKADQVTGELNDRLIQLMYENAEEVLDWLMNKANKPFYYETDSQIFVHAGIKEETHKWQETTTEETFLWKKPAETGSFYKDIIAGHIASALVAEDDSYLGKVYWDGANHFYIDGAVHETKTIPLLVYDCEKKTYESYRKEAGRWVKEKTGDQANTAK